MKEFTRDIAEKMMAEDPWLRSESAPQLMLIMQYMQLSENPPIPTNLEISIELAELETVEYDNSPVLHSLLGALYQNSSRELGEEFKLMIEKLKLEKKGEQTLLKCMNMPASEISDLFSNEKIAIPFKEGTIEINPQAAHAYISSRNVAAYMSFNNSTRAYHHFSKSLELSGRNNPTIFKHMIEPTVLLYMTPWAFETHAALKSGDNPSGYPFNPLKQWFVDDYRATTKRVERNI